MNEVILAVYGASGCGRGVMPLARFQAEQLGVNPNRVVFVDDQLRVKKINGHRVLKYSEFLTEPASSRQVCIAIANSQVREVVAAKCVSDGVHPWTVRAANAIVMDETAYEEGAILCPFVTLTSNIRIGRHFHANLYSYVEHDCVIGDFVTFAPAVKCNGNVHIHDHAYIGSGAVIKQGKPGKPLVIGHHAVVGMGAVVTKNVPDGVTVVGNPAKPLC